MAGYIMMSKILFMLMLLIYQAEWRILAVKLNKIPCYIEYNDEKHQNTDDSHTVGSYKVLIHTSWMKHKGCFFKSTSIPEQHRQQLHQYSPGRCSLLCESYHYFSVQQTSCVCIQDMNMLTETRKTTCCNGSYSDSSFRFTCGSDQYVDVYEHVEDLQARVQNNVDTKCMVARKNDSKITHKAVSCSERYDGFFLYHDRGSHNSSNLTKSETNDLALKWIMPNDDQFPKNIFLWTPFIRSEVLILEIKQIELNYSTCQLEKGQNWRTTSLSLNQTKTIPTFIDLQCSLKRKIMCNVVNVTDMMDTKLKTSNVWEYISSTSIPTDSEYKYVQPGNSTEGEATYVTLSTEAESKSLSTHAESTFIYESNTTDDNFLFEKPVFFLQIGIAAGVSCMVIVFAISSCCINTPKRSEENIVMATEGPPQDTIPTAALAENYSEPKDKSFSSSEMEGPRFCASQPCQNTNYEKTDNGEYHHLDFTLRSETTPRFADNSEYDHTRVNVVSVFEQPWDTATSKVNKLFSQISKSVVQKGQNMRKSLIKRRESRSGSPKLKCRASDYCDAWKTQLNKQQFVFDSDVDDKSNVSIDGANSNVDSNKDKPKLRRTDSAFPVLPYSERINVKSTHIYDEPDDRRMSLRERLLHMISIRPLKMPFGIELDLRASRSKSKIYSLATSIDEIDESIA